ncbi:MAG: hypothetical protein WC523_00265 [Patescibacteria group bacterium]
MKKTRKKPSACAQTVLGTKCLGKYNLSFDGIIPIFICDTCGHKDTTWKKFYEEYLELYKTKENWNNPKNTVSCILGIFCFCYKEFYKIDYTFIPKSPNPYSIKECRDAWILLAAFDNNIHDVRKYIIWIFGKGISKSTTITNFGYILTPALIQKYKIYCAKKHILTRASKLPENFIKHCETNFPDIFKSMELGTMNDLGALLNHVKYYDKNIKDDGLERKVLDVASQMGLITNGKLNIGEN